VADITTRQTTATGATNKGSPLTNSELDQNFVNINADLCALPQNTKSANYGPVLTDMGNREFFFTATAAFTIPANAAVAFPIGTTFEVSADAGAVVTIAITTDTLRWIPVNSTGSRTLTGPGSAVIQKKKSGEWWISGAGVT
jgi:hypothetical protein